MKLPRDLAEQTAGRLSFGERAKVALVRVLVSGANVLLIDEPTNHLEIEAQAALQRRFANFPARSCLFPTTGDSSRTWPTRCSILTRHDHRNPTLSRITTPFSLRLKIQRMVRSLAGSTPLNRASGNSKVW